MRIGMCTSIEHLSAARDAGYDFAELTVTGSLVSEKDESVFAPIRKQLAASPIPIEAYNVFLPGSVKVTGPSVDMPAVASYMKMALKRVADTGGTIVVFGSGAARRTPDGFSVECAWQQLADAARQAGDLAGPLGITIVMEPLLKRACNFFNRVDQGRDFVDRLNHPRVKLLADLYHMAAENEPFENMVDAGTRLFHVHLATPAIPETGEGVAYDFKGFFAALKRAGYDARVTVEDNPGLLKNKAAPMTEVFRAIKRFVEGEMKP